jgi:P4 family phage/plasmid primase-like protien
MEKQTIINHFAGNYSPFYGHFLTLQKATGDEMKAVCPFHEDGDPSLSVNMQNGLFKCFGCGAAGSLFDFYAQINSMILPRDFSKVMAGIAKEFGITNGNGNGKRTSTPKKVVVRYTYKDENDNLSYQIERLDPKSFRIRRPDGACGWIYKKDAVKIIPYHLPEILKGDEILIVEGEKDCDNLAAIGLTATTNPFGAGKWPVDFGPFFAGKQVIVIPDNDATGDDHMQQVAKSLVEHAASIKWLELPGLPEKGDVSDWLNDSANTKDRLTELIKNAADWIPQDDTEIDPESLYEKFLNRINETDNVNLLVNDIALEVRKSELSNTLKHALLKIIARKTGGTVRTIYSDTRQEGDINDSGIDHLKTAMDAIQQVGPENIIYVSVLRTFRTWTGKVWTATDDRVIFEKVISILSNSSEITKNLIDSISDLIRTLTFKDHIDWDADRGVIPVKNGELSYREGNWILSPHDREHYRTTIIQVDYDPQATAPRFEKFLDEIFEGDPDATEKAILLCEMIGYTLVTSCEYEKFILLIGPGANGKSVLLDVIRLMIGTGQVAAVQPDQMDNRFQRAHLHGKLANIVTEIKEGGEIADAALKSITSGELMTAEHKFKPPFDFQPFSTCWFGTNHMPHTRDFSDALFRRALIVEFNRIFSEDEQDKHLKKKLAAELPGIMLLALAAFAGVIERGCFTIPESCVSAKNQWRLEADQVAQFLKYCCAMDPCAWVEASLLYKSYQQWADENGIKRVLNQINFSKRIQRLGGIPARKSFSRGYDGIRLTISGV